MVRLYFQVCNTMALVNLFRQTLVKSSNVHMAASYFSMCRSVDKVIRKNQSRQAVHDAITEWKRNKLFAFYRGYSSEQNSDNITARIKSLVNNNKVVVFMKGIPDDPRCGFSNAVIQILRMHGVEYDSHDVLEDEDLRAGIKVYSDWPTIPQVYLNGEFIGGCDILLQMHQSGDLIEELQAIGIRSALLDKENVK